MDGDVGSRMETKLLQWNHHEKNLQWSHLEKKKSHKEATMEKTCYNETIMSKTGTMKPSWKKLLQWSHHEKIVSRKLCQIYLFMLIHINSSSIKQFYHSVSSCENVGWSTKSYFIYKTFCIWKVFWKVGLDGHRCHGIEAVDKRACLEEVRWDFDRFTTK